MTDPAGRPETDIIQRYQQLTAQISRAACETGRDADAVRLLAVSKRQPQQAMRQLYALGQRDFGENYVNEALTKMTALEDLNITWHYIGPVQSNKTRQIVKHFDWVQSVDRLRIVQRLESQRPDEMKPLQCLIQVNLAGEAQKSGVSPDQLDELVAAFSDLKRLQLRGFMLIPPISDDERDNRHWFAAACRLYRHYRQISPEIDTLSMGMSGDLESAISEGSSMVRVGTALFGPRSVSADTDKENI